MFQLHKTKQNKTKIVGRYPIRRRQIYFFNSLLNSNLSFWRPDCCCFMVFYLDNSTKINKYPTEKQQIQGLSANSFPCILTSAVVHFFSLHFDEPVLKNLHFWVLCILKKNIITCSILYYCEILFRYRKSAMTQNSFGCDDLALLRERAIFGKTRISLITHIQSFHFITMINWKTIKP